MTSSAVKPIPEGWHSITPHLVCAGAAEAITFYEKAFGAVELMRLNAPDGQLMHASLRIGDSTLMLAGENPAWGTLGPKTLNGSPVTIHLFVENVDAGIERAVAAGATLKMAPADMFWGDRYGLVEDPFGHKWSLATHLRDMTQDQIHQAMKAMCA